MNNLIRFFLRAKQEREIIENKTELPIDEDFNDWWYITNQDAVGYNPITEPIDAARAAWDFQKRKIESTEVLLKQKEKIIKNLTLHRRR